MLTFKGEKAKVFSDCFISQPITRWGSFSFILHEDDLRTIIYRVETLFTPDFQVLEKTPQLLEKLIYFNHFWNMTHHAYMGYTHCEIAAGINDRLDIEPEAALGAGEKLARQISKKIADFGN